ncbi:hypothetical protein [Saccharopolyspora sp. 5N708]|uniref:hypothetical protein n=1 Tax=Saccharopolyspora sp. 5N708 TaxID=3457424 RepID=UPI003FD41060
MAQTKIRTRRGFKVLGAVAGAAFALMVTAGCNDPVPSPEQQQEQQDDDQQDGDQQDDQEDDG